MKLTGVFLATVWLAPAVAQDTPQLVPIQGVVLDKASRTPIAGARVSAVAVNTGVPAVLNGTTDSGGVFALSVPGGAVFSLEVSAAGYQGFQQNQPAPGHKSVFLEVTMNRLADIRGRLVDDETRKPVAGVSMALVPPDQRVIWTTPMGMQDRATTQDDGSFQFTNLHQGDYYLRIQGNPMATMQEIPAKDLAGDGREKALQVPEPSEGYGIVMWPSDDADASTTQPLKVTSDVVDVGDIRLRRYKLHNLSGVLGLCEEGANLQVLLLAKNGQGSVRLADLDTKCGSGFRIVNLSNGTFTLVAQGGPPRLFTSEVIDGETRGPLVLNVLPSVSVQIAIEVEGVDRTDFPGDLKRVNIGLTPENAPVKIDPPDQIAPDEYEAQVFGNERYRLSVTPPPVYYLKKLSYNGVDSADLTGFTATQERSLLRLTLSNHPGVVEVQAPVRSMVILWKEGAKVTDGSIGDRRINQPVGADGKVRFAGLSPGRYRAFLADGSLPFSQAGIEEGLRHSTAVTVEEGQTASVSLTF